MDDDELRELEDPDTWDLDNVQIHQPVRGALCQVVSIELSRDNFGSSPPPRLVQWHDAHSNSYAWRRIQRAQRTYLPRARR